MCVCVCDITKVLIESNGIQPAEIISERLRTPTTGLEQAVNKLKPKVPKVLRDIGSTFEHSKS